MYVTEFFQFCYNKMHTFKVYSLTAFNKNFNVYKKT